MLIHGVMMMVRRRVYMMKMKINGLIIIENIGNRK